MCRTYGTFSGGDNWLQKIVLIETELALEILK